MSMWRLLHDSITGESHVRDGIPCQDAFQVANVSPIVGNSTLVLVCADGAGSASLSHLGSRIACDTACNLAQNFLEHGGDINSITREHAIEWIATIRAKLQDVASGQHVAVRELASTLLVSILGNTSSVFIQLGDGAFVVQEQGTCKVVFWPQNGEYANTTFFVTDEDATDRFAFAIKPPFDEVAVLTDGLQSLALDFARQEAYSPFFLPMFDALRAASSSEDLAKPFRDWLLSPQITQRTDDDKTLMLAVRNSLTSADG